MAPYPMGPVRTFHLGTKTPASVVRHLYAQKSWGKARPAKPCVKLDADMLHASPHTFDSQNTQSEEEHL
jgi:hypothetical protein